MKIRFFMALTLTPASGIFLSLLCLYGILDTWKELYTSIKNKNVEERFGLKVQYVIAYDIVRTFIFILMIFCNFYKNIVGIRI